MIEALNDSLRRFADFKGRSNKLQYISFLLFYILVDLLINLVNPNALVINNLIMGLPKTSGVRNFETKFGLFTV